jgi:hydroxymethylbilane synthase
MCGLAEIPAGALVGTSSVRRARQVTHLRPDLEVVDVRGNVPTRLEKLAAGADGLDAILLAEAGMLRLGFLAEGGEAGIKDAVAGMPGLVAVRLAEDWFYPAAGQGAIGLEIRAGDDRARALARAVGDAATWLRITAEREFLRLLGAGCHTPVGVFSRLDGGVLTLKARVFAESGGAPVCGETSGEDPLATARTLYQSLKSSQSGADAPPVDH